MKHQIAEVEVSYRPNKMIGTVKIKDSHEAYTMLMRCWNANTIEFYEEFKLLLLNNSNEILGVYTTSKGGYTATMVDLRMMFSVILKSGATSFITAHNHPSGN